VSAGREQLDFPFSVPKGYKAAATGGAPTSAKPQK
jgi:hypothetical protein